MKKRNYFLPFLLAALITVLLCCSCTTNRHVKKSTETTQTTTETATTSTINEQADTCITTQASNVASEISLADLLDGDTLREETADISIKTHYDPVKKKVITKATAKPKTIPFKFDRVTVKQEKKKEAIKKTVQVKEKEVERGWSMWNWLWLLLIPAGWLVWNRFA